MFLISYLLYLRGLFHNKCHPAVRGGAIDVDGWMDVGSREGSVGCCTADPGNFQFSASVLMLFPLKLSEKKKKSILLTYI